MKDQQSDQNTLEELKQSTDKIERLNDEYNRVANEQLEELQRTENDK